MAVRCAVRMRYVCFAPGTGSRDDSSYPENVVVCDDSVASCGTGLLVADGDRVGASACLGCGGEDSRDEQERQWEKEEDCSFSHYRFFISWSIWEFSYHSAPPRRSLGSAWVDDFPGKETGTIRCDG